MKQKLTYFIVNTATVTAMVAPMFVNANQIMLNFQTFGFIVQYIYALFMVLLMLTRSNIKVDEVAAAAIKSKVIYLNTIISAIAAIIVGHPILAIAQLLFIAFLKSLKPN